MNVAARKINGGEGGIRTHGGREPTAVFKTAALNHSATCPYGTALFARRSPAQAWRRRRGNYVVTAPVAQAAEAKGYSMRLLVMSLLLSTLPAPLLAQK